jgi:hypothetical protein
MRSKNIQQTENASYIPVVDVKVKMFIRHFKKACDRIGLCDFISGDIRRDMGCYTNVLIIIDVTNLYSSITKYLTYINKLGMKIGSQEGLRVRN